MRELLTEILVHLAQSHRQMARILDAKRHVIVRMAQLTHAIPDAHPDLGGLTGLIGVSSRVTRNVIAYLGSVADLEEAVADSLEQVVKVAGEADEE
jgi:hypothetical protein